MINKLTYAGHSAIFLHADKYVIAIDPWLKGNPLCPKELIEPEKIDLIVLSHGHSDHAGDAVRLAKKYNCKVAATFELAGILVSEGVAEENAIFMNKGGEIDFNGYKIALTQAFHSNSYNSKYAGEACGVIVSDGKNTFYHAGDTLAFSDMKLITELYSPTYALLPIGDCFTMGPKQASMAARFINAKNIIPIHYATFPALTGKPDEFKKLLGNDYNMIEIAPGGSIQI